MNAREQKIQALIEPTIHDLGLVLWGMELLSSGKQTLLRVYIDRPDTPEQQGGVTVDDCADVSREIGDLLDVEEVFSTAFTLEVSSPGMDCILFTPEQYVANVGQQVDVRLNVPFERRKRITGLLVGVEDNEAIVRADDEEYLLPLENINRARVVPLFEKKAKR